MLSRLVIHPAAFLMFFSTNLAAEPTADWQQPDYIVKAFKEIALKNEYRTTTLRILKWRQPIRFRYHYHGIPNNPLVEQLFDTHFAHLQKITGHPINQSDSESNLDIHLTRDQNYGSVIQNHTVSSVSNLNRESHCMGSFSSQADGEIHNAQIVIPLDHVFSRGLLVSCVIEESTQLMGLPNDSEWVHPSIANDHSKIEFLTGLDYLMLKILYDPSIKPGMHGKKLDNKLKQVIKRLATDNEIEQAQRKVNQDGLYRLVN